MSKRLFQMSMILAALTFSILACSFSFSSAKIENARLAKDKDGAQTVTQFSPQDTFYLVGSLANAPDDTLLKSVWTAVKADGHADNSVIKELEARGGSGNFWFELARDSSDWPRGQYKVDLYMNDKLEQTLNFDVVGPDPTPTPAAEALATLPPDPQLPVNVTPGSPISTETVASLGQAGISNLHTTKDEADAEPAVAFAQDDVIYAHFNLEASDGQANVHGALIAVAVEGLEPESVFTELNDSFPAGLQWIKFSNTNPWPLGRYRVDVTVNGASMQSVNIEIVRTNTSGGQLQNVYASVDDRGQQPATVFPTNAAISVMFTLVNAPAGAEIKGVMVAREVEGLDPDAFVTEASGQIDNGTYPITFTNEGPWPTGQYVIFLYLNGEFVQQVDVTVQ